MVKSIAVSELKARCLRVVDEVARKRKELVVTKHGKPVARLVPVAGHIDDNRLARLRGTLIGGTRLADFDSPVAWKATRRR